MSIMPYWNTEENHMRYQKDKSETNGFCPECHTPIISAVLYCSSCQKKLLTRGLEDKRIRIGHVGRATTPYQQSLHTSFFGCNAPVAYRGKKEDRIYTKVKQSTIDNAERRLDWLLTKQYYTYQLKTYRTKIAHRKLYKKIRARKNVTRRLVYNVVLFFLNYTAQDNDFKSLAHFQASMIANLHINIENTFIRTIDSTDAKYIHQVRSNYTAKYYYHMWESLSAIVEPVMEEIMSNRRNGLENS